MGAPYDQHMSTKGGGYAIKRVPLMEVGSDWSDQHKNLSFLSNITQTRKRLILGTPKNQKNVWWNEGELRMIA